MAMTLRLPEDLDRALAEIAERKHMSKHAVIIEAAERFAATESSTDQAVDIADRVAARYADLLRRLSDA